MLMEIGIDELQPTEVNLDSRTMGFYESCFPLLREINPPEVWIIDNKAYIADGNNQVYDRYRRGKSKIFTQVFTPKTCNVSSDAYMMVVEEILKKAKIAQNQGITHISHLE